MNIAQSAGAGATAGTAGVVGVGVPLGLAATGPIAIGLVAVAALLGAFGAVKTKTQHLNFGEASKLSKQFADTYAQQFVDKFGSSTANGTLAYELAKRMITYLESYYLNPGSNSYQYWLGNAVQDLRNRLDGKDTLDLGSVVYVYGVFLGLNYDASRPKEWAEFMANDLSQFWSSIAYTFPNLGLEEFLNPVITNAAAAKNNQSVLEQTLGINTGDLSGAVSSQQTSAPAQVSSNSASMSASKNQLFFAFVALGGIIYAATKRK